MTQVKIPKRVVVMRADLKMGKGKIAVQGSHACEKTPVIGPFSREVLKIRTGAEPVVWNDLEEAREAYSQSELHKKVCLRVESEVELQAVYDAAINAGLPVTKVVDFGLTEFHGVKTFTCIAIGPVFNHHVDPIVGHLRLY